jgi:SAM-dependent methyltransferase
MPNMLDQSISACLRALRGWRSRTSRRTPPLLELHQAKTSTRFDRYPEIMRFVRGQVGMTATPLRILSFGCSTGEECASLQTYFPESHIVGVDVDERSLATARKTWRSLSDGKIEFVHAESLDHENGDVFDVIFCMAVLLRHPETMSLDNCSRIYPFNRFDDALCHLDRLLRVSGYLIVQNSNFRVSDSTVGPRYRAVPGNPGSDGWVQDITMFDRNNARIPRVATDAVFQKLAVPEGSLREK